MTPAEMEALREEHARLLVERVKATELVADGWNRLHPVGTPVTYWPGRRKGPGRRSRTRSKAWVLEGHTAVVSVEGHAACVALTHVQVIRDGGAS
ncbi:hypothetical protein [Thermomonospora umbrina]|uniref:Uncharacterized protein n=1 Tax=Thermomonospora umbrina TaxID=111806 RepID=A0A3D9T906_9ACTN|nr:hypothetical protein [Thermomonospora umbrina]REF00242.1 hypothetical protein DFJ69_5770 [Thermomonospora umbrina]